jgi:dTDP-4-amino-4,6-dideoxygalactose transaminase
VLPSSQIPFNVPPAIGTELPYVGEAIASGRVGGDGPFTVLGRAWLEDELGCERALLTTSCSSALEAAALVAGVGPGDEVIMPSFTFVSTANAFALRGATPVFVDVRPDTLNLDEGAVEDAVTSKTRAIVPVHYGGVACEMDAIGDVAASHGFAVIEDAAHALLGRYRGRSLGSLGGLAALSFERAKNVTCGEGGALIVNDPAFVERAEVVRDGGTDRSKFMRGEIDTYTWLEVGSSCRLSDIAAAYLFAQLERARELTERRLRIWERYHDGFATLEDEGLAQRPSIPAACEHNAHLYYLLLPDPARRDYLIAALERRGIEAQVHSVPLHSAPAGRRVGRTAGPLPVTDDVSSRLVRLPLWADLPEEGVERVIDAVTGSVRAAAGSPLVALSR